MKFNFAHLGGIDNGTVELGDLTVICGPNNMVKLPSMDRAQHLKKFQAAH